MKFRGEEVKKRVMMSMEPEKMTYLAGIPDALYSEDFRESEADSRVSEDTASYAASFRDLHMYKTAMNLAGRIFHLSRGFPMDETYSLTDQIRRSSRSITANMAEAWAKRNYEAHFISKLTDSMAETHETQAWLDHALTCDYISAEQHREFDSLANFVAAMIRNASAKSATFCTPRK